MPVMGFTKFERFFRAAAEVRVDRDDTKRYLDFVNDVLYDMLLAGQATAKANARDIIEPRDLPVTAGLQQCLHQFERIDEDIELRPILDDLAARPPLLELSEASQTRLPLLFGAVSVALARVFRIVDAELSAVHAAEWEHAFRILRVLV
jgi:hypothetical protein